MAIECECYVLQTRGFYPHKSCDFDRLTVEMSVTLQAVDTLQSHEGDLRRMGARHAAVFGSVARGEAGSKSDVDVLVELDSRVPMGLFEYARVKLYIGELIAGADVVNRKAINPLMKDSILRDAVDAF